MLSSCGSEQKEALFWGRVPQLRRMYTQGCYVAVPTAGSHRQLLVDFVQKSLRYYRFCSSSRPKREVSGGCFFFFSSSTLTTRRDETSLGDFAVPTGTGTHACQCARARKTQMRKVEFQFGIDPILVFVWYSIVESERKATFWIRPLPPPPTTTPPTHLHP